MVSGIFLPQIPLHWKRTFFFDSVSRSSTFLRPLSCRFSPRNLDIFLQNNRSPTNTKNAKKHCAGACDGVFPNTRSELQKTDNFSRLVLPVATSRGCTNLTKLLCRHCSSEFEPMSVRSKRESEKEGREVEGYQCPQCGLIIACVCEKYLQSGICVHALSSLEVCPSECEGPIVPCLGSSLLCQGCCSVHEVHSADRPFENSPSPNRVF